MTSNTTNLGASTPLQECGKSLRIPMAEQAAEVDRLHAASGKPLMFTEFAADALPGRHSIDADPGARNSSAK